MFQNSLIKVNSKNLIGIVRYTTQVLPSFTSEKLDIKRKNFAALQNTDINYFKSILSEDRVVTSENDILPFNLDWFKQCRGQSKLLLKPKTTVELSQILKHCNERRLAVCPQGGNTGVCGGSVPVFDEIILQMGLMNKIISLDEVSGVLVCEAGCILETLENHAKEHGLIMPLDLGGKGSCHIGGNVSTNAGGQRLLRYGNLHGSVLGLEAVKADGTVIDCLKTLKKDNTGYHLKHMFIGSEGTLGIVTKVAIHCPVLPKAVNVAYFGLNTFEEILQVYKEAKSSLGEIISAFEMMDNDSVKTVVRNMNFSNPLPDYPFYVLLETHGSDTEHDSEKLSRFLSKEIDKGRVLNGIIASEPAKIKRILQLPRLYLHIVDVAPSCGNKKAIWKLRENIPGAGLKEAGYLFTSDISLPSVHYYEIVPKLREKLRDKVQSVYGFGHLGDGNIHINVALSEFNKEILSLVETTLYEEVANLNGSISAEHGVGVYKSKFLHYSKDESALQLMRELKQLMDPNGILNPYKVLQSN